MRRGAPAAGALALLLGGVAIVALTGRDGPGGSQAASSRATATTTIERRDLVEIETADGTLGYSDSRTVVNRLSGTVTWLPKAGTVVRSGGRLFAVDGAAVHLLDGSVPAHRDLAPGASGADVRQLERNLRALGFDAARAMSVDGTWDTGTTAAVKRWQTATGLRASGTIALGRIVFQPGDRRVSKLAVRLGSTAGSGGGGGGPSSDDSSAGATEAMTTTSTRRIVTVKLDTTKGSLAKHGARVSIELPSGEVARGAIARVGRTAQSESTADGQPGSPKIKLTIRLARRVTAIDQAPVTVRLEQSRAADVLAIPVTALLARSGGRFAVEVVERSGRRRIVAVDTGLFTSGHVEIDGAGLRPGMRVADARV